jgi:hypothetical protein
MPEEKDATILELQQAAETTREALETEKKQVEGKSPLLDSSFVAWVRRDLLSTYSSSAFQACGLLSGRRRRKRRRSRRPTTPPSRSWRFCERQPSRHARASTRATGKPGAPWRVASGPWAAMSPGVCGLRSAWGSKRPSAWCSHITGLNLAALATGYIVPNDLDEDGAEAEANRLDALAAPATDILATTSRRSSSWTLPPRALKVSGHLGL